MVPGANEESHEHLCREPAATITKDELMDLFVGFGEVSSINLITDRVTGELRGFGFVEMPTQSEAKSQSRASMEPPLRAGRSR
jgi:hypothetical protein